MLLHMTKKPSEQPNVNVGENVEVATSREDIIREKMENERLLREGARADATDPNDLPGFEDGVKGGWDGEVREGDPNSTTPNDPLESDAHSEGGAGTQSSGGIDGGPKS